MCRECLEDEGVFCQGQDDFLKSLQHQMKNIEEMNAETTYHCRAIAIFFFVVGLYCFMAAIFKHIMDPYVMK
jgi:hypothetical protein